GRLQSAEDLAERVHSLLEPVEPHLPSQELPQRSHQVIAPERDAPHVLAAQLQAPEQLADGGIEAPLEQVLEVLFVELSTDVATDDVDSFPTLFHSVQLVFGEPKNQLTGF